MIKTSLKVLALLALVLGAAGAASACGDDKKDNSSAAYTSTEGSTCASKMSKEACAAKMAAGECKAHASATMASAGGHCSMDTSAVAECTYGENTVTYSGACAAGHDADYSFAIAGAECKGTGAAAAKAIKSVKGVASVTVDYDKHMAYVCADKRVCSQKNIEKSLKTAGFDEVKFVNASKENCAKSHGAKVDA